MTNIDAVAQVADSTKVKPIYDNQRLNSSYRDLQKYFLEQEKTFVNYDGPVYLYSISYDTVNLPDPSPRYFRLGYDYLWGLNTHTITLGVNPVKYKDAGWNYFISGRVGFGAGESRYVLEDEDTNARINSLWGIEGEVESPYFFKKTKFFKNFKFFGGIGLSYLKPENYILKEAENPSKDSINQSNGGSVIDPFVGVRYYLTSPGSKVKVALQAKFGLLYSNGIKHLDDEKSPIYIGFGANIISAQSFTKKGNVGWMNFESGIFISTASGVLYGQFTQPVRLMQNLSVGLNGHVGSGLYNSIYNDKRVNTYWGIGLDLRFFGYDYGQIVKPYLGVMFQNYGYHLPQDTILKYQEKILPFLRIGTKVQLGRKSNWCLDVNASVPLVSKDTFMVYQEGATSRVLKQPVIFEVNVGLVYKIRLFEEKTTDYYMGKVQIYPADSVSKLGEAKFDPLPMDMFADQMIEKKVYLEQKPNMKSTGSMPKIDVTDIKLLRFIYDSRSSFDRPSPNFLYNVKGKSQDSIVLLIAMFDKGRCDIDAVSKNNMYLVFNDLNKSRYFGFTYDYNKQLQPETRTQDNLVIGGEDSYYGNYREFIKKLHWLDEDVLPLEVNSLDGKEIEGDIFHYFDLYNKSLKADCEAKKIKPYTVDKNNFRFAYAIYPQETFAKIKESCKEYGVSIMFRFDLDKSNSSDDEIYGFTQSMDGSLIIDPNDAAFFSNLIHGSEIYSPCTGNSLVIDDFELGKDYLTASHKDILNNVKAYDCRIAEVYGYTDKVEFASSTDFMNDLFSFQKDAMVRSCVSLGDELDKILGEWQGIMKHDANAIPPDELCQRGLAWKRIRSTLDELDQFGFDIRSIMTYPVGIDPSTSRGDSNPRSRKVVINFSN